MLIVAVLLTCLMLTVIATDISRYIIPNWLVGMVIALYPVLLVVSPVRLDWKMALLVALGMFVVGFLLFCFHVMGGGDVKLLAATSLYTGLQSFLPFVCGVALVGGVIALLLLLLRPTTAYLFSRLKHPPAIPRVLTHGEPVPYGVGIAVTFLALLWQGDFPGLKL